MSDYKNITLKIHLPMDFLYSLFAVGTEKHFFKMISDFNLDPSDEISHAIKTLKESLSAYMEQELYYFFDLSGIGYIFYHYILQHSEVDDIPKLLQLFLESDSNELIFNIVKSVCKNIMPKENSKEYEELSHNIDKMLELVDNTEFQDNLRRERVIESIKNPEETKQRLYYIMNQFYSRSFITIEKNILNIIITQMEKYKILFQSNPDKFIEQYLNLVPSEGLEPIICLSFFKYISWHHYSIYANGTIDWFVLGIYTDLLFNENFCFERYSNYFKALSDPNRIAILKLLSQRPWYGQELAEKLKLTPATISYHMAFLQKVGVIAFQKTDNRSYYCLNHNNLMKPITDFSNFIEKD